MDSAALAMNTCPTKWQIKLLEAEDLNRFHTLRLNREHLRLEDAQRCKDSALTSDVKGSKSLQSNLKRSVPRDKMRRDSEQFPLKTLPGTSDTLVRNLAQASSDPVIVRSSSDSLLVRPGPLRNVLHSRGRL